MQHSPTGLPRPIRSLSIDSLCVADDESLSLAAAHEASTSPAAPATADFLRDDSVRHSIAIPPASTSNTKSNSITIDPSAQQSKLSAWEAMFFHDKWLWETTSILFSLACVIAITVLSSRLDGTWLSKWTFFLQPSTTFSILITAAESSMMVSVAEVLSQLKWLQTSLPKARSVADFAAFDSASRGPLGSLSLFYLWKPRSMVLLPLVYAASLITIAALAMGPFTQQIISIQAENLVPQEGINSTVAVSNYYNHDPAARGLQMSISVDGAILTSLSDATALEVESDIQGSFYNGYYMGKSAIDFSCPSSNCSWGTFNSLGLCSNCQDVSETTQIIKAVHDGGGGDTWTLLTPQGWLIDGFDSWHHVEAIANDSSESWTLETLSANLVSMVLLQRGSRIPGQHFTVTECSIDWCAKRYSNITVVNGELQEHYSIQELPLWTVSGQNFGGLATGGTGVKVNNWLLLLTPNTDRSNLSFPLPPFDHGGLNVSIYDHLGLSSFFVSHFNFSSESTTVLFGNGQNVTSTLQNITDSMTNTMIKSSSELPALGIVWHQEPSIHVQRAWLALPLALVLSSAILLVSTIVATSHFHAPQWKSSPLPFLYHGIRDWDDDEKKDLAEGRIEKVHVMEDRARLKRVRIFTTSKGGRWLAE